NNNNNNNNNGGEDEEDEDEEEGEERSANTDNDKKKTEPLKKSSNTRMAHSTRVGKAQSNSLMKVKAAAMTSPAQKSETSNDNNNNNNKNKGKPVGQNKAPLQKGSRAQPSAGINARRPQAKTDEELVVGSRTTKGVSAENAKNTQGLRVRVQKTVNNNT
ncbi:hypothetical protein RFI_33275, partial [Reticulomyxa filosa]